MQFKLNDILKITLIVYIFFTLFYFVIKKNSNKPLMLFLLLTVTNIIVSSILLKFSLSIKLIYNIYVILAHSLLLHLLIISTRIKFCIVPLFLIFSIINLIFIEGYNFFNTKSFVLSSIMYLIIFIYISFNKIKNDDLEFFTNNNFILISSPIIYFIGFSLMFGFKSKILNDVKLINGLKLFDFISFFVNIVFYTLINIFIFKQNNLKDAT